MPENHATESDPEIIFDETRGEIPLVKIRMLHDSCLGTAMQLTRGKVYTVLPPSESINGYPTVTSDHGWPCPVTRGEFDVVMAEA